MQKTHSCNVKTPSTHILKNSYFLFQQEMTIIFLNLVQQILRIDQ